MTPTTSESEVRVSKARRDRRQNTFTYEEDLVTARDTESGVAASGTSKPVALSRLADALALHAGGGEPIDDEEAFFEEIRMDAGEIDDTGE